MYLMCTRNNFFHFSPMGRKWMSNLSLRICRPDVTTIITDVITTLPSEPYRCFSSLVTRPNTADSSIIWSLHHCALWWFDHGIIWIFIFHRGITEWLCTGTILVLWLSSMSRLFHIFHFEYSRSLCGSVEEQQRRSANLYYLIRRTRDWMDFTWMVIRMKLLSLPSNCVVARQVSCTTKPRIHTTMKRGFGRDLIQMLHRNHRIPDLELR